MLRDDPAAREPNVVRYMAIRKNGKRSTHRKEVTAMKVVGKTGHVERVSYFTTGVAARALGVSSTTFRRLATLTRTRPAQTYYSSPGGKGQHNALWSPEQVERLREIRGSGAILSDRTATTGR